MGLQMPYPLTRFLTKWCIHLTHLFGGEGGVAKGSYSCYPKADDLIGCWNGLMKTVPYKQVPSSSVGMDLRTKRNESGLRKV